MLFIPLIENTIKHSNKSVSKPGITIEFSIDESRIHLKTLNFIKILQKDKTNENGPNIILRC